MASDNNTFSIDCQNEAAKLLREKIELKSLCTSLGVRYTEGRAEHYGSVTQTITQQFDTITNNDDWIDWLNQNKPDFMLIEPKVLPELSNVWIFDLVSDQEKLNNFRSAYDYLNGCNNHPPTFDVYCFFKGISICTKYTWFSVFNSLYMEKPNYDDDFSDSSEDDEEDYRTLEKDEIIKYSDEISKLPDFSSAKTIAQRAFFVSEYFSSLEIHDIEEHQMRTIAQNAGVRFDMEVLPNLIKGLSESGLSDKEISEKIGQTVNKIKRILN